MWRKVLDVNILAVCVCTREAIKSMKAHGIDGHIIHISSIYGHFVKDLPPPLRYINVYPGTKHALTALAEVLRVELRNEESNIKISVSNKVSTLIIY